MKKTLLSLLIIFTCLLPAFAMAEDVLVTAQVNSKVSPTLSTLNANLSKLPADGISSVIITVTAKFQDGNPATNRVVSLSSNRGEVDLIYFYSGGTLTKGFSTTTDSNGVARFSVRSKAPGVATFTGIVDTVTINNKPSVTFTPLPFLSNISVSVTLPGDNKINILEPSTPTVEEDGGLVNTQLELQIPFWYFILLILILISSPIFFLLLLIIYGRLRLAVAKNEESNKREEDLLAKIYALEQQISQYQQVDMAETKKIEQKEEDILKVVSDKKE